MQKLWSKPPRGRDIAANELSRAEIEGSAGYRYRFPGRDEACVDGKVATGLDRKLVVEDSPPALALQVEVGVVREVDDGLGVGRGLVGYGEGSLFTEQ